MKKTYSGSCHCGKVRFEADVDDNAAQRRCHCWICVRQRVWETRVRPEDFRLLAGAADLDDIPSGAAHDHQGHHLMCRHCGTASFGRGFVDATGTEYVSVAAGCFDHALDHASSALTPGLRPRARLKLEEAAR
jgi:hypothetical protein